MEPKQQLYQLRLRLPPSQKLHLRAKLIRLLALLQRPSPQPHRCLTQLAVNLHQRLSRPVRHLPNQRLKGNLQQRLNQLVRRLPNRRLRVNLHQLRSRPVRDLPNQRLTINLRQRLNQQARRLPTRPTVNHLLHKHPHHLIQRMSPQYRLYPLSQYSQLAHQPTFRAHRLVM